MAQDVTRLLLVEDDRGQAVLLQDELLRAAADRFELAWAQTLRAALDTIDRQPFDAVLLDLSLPDSQGLETLERVLSLGKPVAIIVLTGQADERLAAEALRAGAEDYLVKDEADGRSIARAVRYSIERRQAREALERANQELETRVSERTEELRRANAELERRTRQLRNLAGELAITEQRERRRIAGMLHDHLQQLLVGARYQVESLKGRAGEEMRRAIDQMDGLIGQSIEVSRSLTAELSPPVLHTSGLGPSLEWLAQWMAGRQNLRVELSLPPRMPAMAEDVTIQLFQSARELLFNVVKHAQVGRAALEVSVTGDTLELRVSDQGVGFDPSLLAQKAGTESFGLFSIRERTSLIGGALRIESQPGTGSRFTLSVPVANLGAAGSPESPTLVAENGRSTASGAGGARAARKTRILLVDDHEITRKGLAQLLAKEGDMELVGEAADGQTSVRLAEELRPDVVVMDVSMPGMNGIEATRLIVAGNPSVRVVALSMYEDEAIASAMREAGAVTYISKSESLRLLVEAVRACGRSGRQR